MFLGLRAATYVVDDVEASKAWFSKILGFGPYFDEPFYVGFNVGGYELGIAPRGGGDTADSDSAETTDSDTADSDSDSDTAAAAGETAAAGPRMYWGVRDIAVAVASLVEMGAEVHEDVQDVGDGIKVASVRDPSGSILGIIENPQFVVTPVDAAIVGSGPGL